MPEWDKYRFKEYPDVLLALWEKVSKLYGTDLKPAL
jgi:hypothetical protein